jgi:hypothetical protein
MSNEINSNSIQFKVGTKITDDVISVTTWDNMKTQISQQLIDTQDKAIKNALIELGWTPPKITLFDSTKNQLTHTEPSITVTFEEPPLTNFQKIKKAYAKLFYEIRWYWVSTIIGNLSKLAPEGKEKNALEIFLGAWAKNNLSENNNLLHDVIILMKEKDF